MTLSAARPRAQVPPPARASVFRDPNGADPALMTRRAWWLAVLHVLVPGSAQALAGNRRLGRFALGVWLLGLLAVLLAAGPLLRAAAGAALDPEQRGRAHGAAGRGARLGGALDRAHARHAAPRAARAPCGPGPGSGWRPCSSSRSWSAPAAPCRPQSRRARPGTRSARSSAAAGSRCPASGRYNILLLGGDAGPGRSGLRPDSISVVSVNAADRPHGDVRPPARPRPDAVRRRLADAEGVSARIRLARHLQRRRVRAELHLHRGAAEEPAALPEREGRPHAAGHRGHEGGRRGLARHPDPVLRAGRHERVREAHRRDGRGHDRREAAAADRRRRRRERNPTGREGVDRERACST